MPALRRDPETRAVAVRLTFELDTKDGQAPRSGPRRKGRPVQIRNGLPARKNYRYGGKGADQCPETAAWDE